MKRQMWLTAAAVLVSALALAGCSSAPAASTSTYSGSYLALRAILVTSPVASTRSPSYVGPMPADWPNFDCAAQATEAVDGNKVMACSSDTKLYLAPAEITTADVKSVVVVPYNGTWAAKVELSDRGTNKLATMSTRLSQYEPPYNSYAVMLGGQVQSVQYFEKTNASGTLYIVGDSKQDTTNIADFILHSRAS